MPRPGVRSPSAPGGCLGCRWGRGRRAAADAYLHQPHGPLSGVAHSLHRRNAGGGAGRVRRRPSGTRHPARPPWTTQAPGACADAPHRRGPCHVRCAARILDPTIRVRSSVVRALGSHPRGRWFETSRAHHRDLEPQGSQRSPREEPGGFERPYYRFTTLWLRCGTCRPRGGWPLERLAATRWSPGSACP